LQEPQSTSGVTPSVAGDVALSKEIISSNHISEKKLYEGCSINVAWLKAHYPPLESIAVDKKRGLRCNICYNSDSQCGPPRICSGPQDFFRD